MTTPFLSPAYRESVKVAVVLQAGVMLFLSLLLDGGRLARVGGVAVVAFWVGAAVVALRRPGRPDTLDLMYIRWGFIALFAVGMVCLGLMGALRG